MKGVKYMQINTKYNAGNLPQLGTKGKVSEGTGDKVVLGGSQPDNNILMADQLKNMKAGDYDIIGNFIGGGLGAGIGAVAGGVGGGVLAAALGAGGWGTMGAVVGGIASGVIVGGAIGWHKGGK
jgi:hypothetical protein